jgi:hypothetical protein
MELNFTEINNTQNPNPYENYDNNSYQSQNTDSQKYWEPNVTQNKNLQPKKKKVTFTDILSNMNLVVNNQGVLQFMAPINQVEEQQVQYSHQQNQYQQQNQYPEQQNQYQQYQKQEPLDPSVKHSYIFNKYFKDYKDITKPKEVKVPKTKEEYIQMVIEERNRQIQERKRIAQIKSKKMMFTTNYTHTSATINASTNSLRKMSFH